jgi:hypothetical protein
MARFYFHHTLNGQTAIEITKAYCLTMTAQHVLTRCAACQARSDELFANNELTFTQRRKFPTAQELFILSGGKSLWRGSRLSSIH